MFIGSGGSVGTEVEVEVEVELVGAEGGGGSFLGRVVYLLRSTPR